MVEWRVYGCGSPSSSRSTQTSYEIVDGANRLHIDLGNGAIYRRCQKEGSIEAAINSIQNLLITHCHPDHCFDLTRLYVSWMYTPGFTPQQRVSLYATQETMAGIRRLMDNTRLEGPFEKVFNAHMIEFGQSIQIDDFSVLPNATGHIEGACGVRIDAPSGKRIAFTSDTGYRQEIFTEFADTDLLVAECSFVDLETPYHLHLGQVAEIAQRIDPECLMLVHFYPDMERALEAEIRSTLSVKYPGDVLLAYDGLQAQWNPDKKRWLSERMF